MFTSLFKASFQPRIALENTLEKTVEIPGWICVAKLDSVVSSRKCHWGIPVHFNPSNWEQEFKGNRCFKGIELDFSVIC